MTTVTLDLGAETMRVRCDLTQANAPVQVQYRPADGWDSTPYQCADTRHTDEGLIDIALALASRATESRCTRDNTDYAIDGD